MKNTPKVKKEKKPVKRTKLVRIDARTVIEVSVNIPDEVAIERFYARQDVKSGSLTTFMGPTVRAEIPSGSLEELSAMVDDSVLPDED